MFSYHSSSLFFYCNTPTLGSCAKRLWLFTREVLPGLVWMKSCDRSCPKGYLSITPFLQDDCISKKKKLQDNVLAQTKKYSMFYSIPFCHIISVIFILVLEMVLVLLGKAVNFRETLKFERLDAWYLAFGDPQWKNSLGLSGSWDNDSHT